MLPQMLQRHLWSLPTAWLSTHELRNPSQVSHRAAVMCYGTGRALQAYTEEKGKEREKKLIFSKKLHF